MTIDIPLRTEPDGTMRVGKTRVTLDVVIQAYLLGSNADQIAADFDALDAADVHDVIGYYLANRAEVDAYLKDRSDKADQRRREWEAEHPGPPLNKAEMIARLEERRQKKQTGES